MVAVKVAALKLASGVGTQPARRLGISRRLNTLQAQIVTSEARTSRAISTASAATTRSPAPATSDVLIGRADGRRGLREDADA